MLIDGDWYGGCVCSLEWWCNAKKESNGKPSRFCIAQNTWLKEFMIQNPPTFPVSAICCKYAKKDVSKKYIKEHDIDLVIMGIRKAEGGIRATAYKTCYSMNDSGVDYHRPIFFYSDETKRNYEEWFGVIHSKCYTDYGMTRTGCAGRPLNMKVSEDVRIVNEHEPKLYGAINKIFSDTYEYTRKYREFQKMMKEQSKAEGQMNIFD
jgi:3'-phosphoadenosine 5'-phosphosulfate sulfotransferase (PAPS reductase)/FAD synthetase